MSNPRIVHTSPSLTPAQARNARARALRFVLGYYAKKRAVPQPPPKPERRPMDRAKQLCQSSSQCMVVLFDLRLPGVADRLLRERAAWQGQSDIQALDGNHFALIVKAGGARRLAR